jgi:hypothetical protein
MGHVNGFTYERSYRTKITDVDVIYAFLETYSDEAGMKLMVFFYHLREIQMRPPSLRPHSVVRYKSTPK